MPFLTVSQNCYWLASEGRYRVGRRETGALEIARPRGQPADTDSGEARRSGTLQVSFTERYVA